MGFCNCSMFCCTLLYVPSSFTIILMGKIESWLLCLVCLPGVSLLFCMALPRGTLGLSAACDCGIP